MMILRAVRSVVHAWSPLWVGLWWTLIVGMSVDEIAAVVERNPAQPPLTNLLADQVPWWITLPFLTWFTLHMTSQYFWKEWLFGWFGTR